MALFEKTGRRKSAWLALVLVGSSALANCTTSETSEARPLPEATYATVDETPATAPKVDKESEVRWKGPKDTKNYLQVYYLGVECPVVNGPNKQHPVVVNKEYLVEDDNGIAVTYGCEDSNGITVNANNIGFEAIGGPFVEEQVLNPDGGLDLSLNVYRPKEWPEYRGLPQIHVSGDNTVIYEVPPGTWMKLNHVGMIDQHQLMTVKIIQNITCSDD